MTRTVGRGRVVAPEAGLVPLVADEAARPLVTAG
jgi:hypothetical protein